MAEDAPETPDPQTPESERPDPSRLAQDPAALKHSHRRYGDYLKKVGLPFEPEEFDEEPDADGDATEPAGESEDEPDGGGDATEPAGESDDEPDGVAAGDPDGAADTTRGGEGDGSETEAGPGSDEPGRKS